MIDHYDDDALYDADFDDELDDYEAIEAALAEGNRNPALILRERQPMFQALFAGAITDDEVLDSFATHVVGRLSDRFALKAAKGGAFFQARDAEGKDAKRYRHDQTMRAHLINGMLPALQIARQLATWNAHKFTRWDERHERLFIAGYMLHDYTKLDTVKESLKKAGFKEWSAPSEDQIPVLMDVFREWCEILGLDAFLKSVGGAGHHLQDLIYIACNTQTLKGTVRNPRLLPDVTLDIRSLDLLADVSRLADLIAYVARTPRDVVGHPTVTKVMREYLTFDKKLGRSVARLNYHHVAENRGLLLNFIHDAVIAAVQDEARIPLLFAPSGVVYLERYDAPNMPSVDHLTDKIVQTVRQKSGERAIAKQVGTQVNKDGLRAGDIINDLFDLDEIVHESYRLVTQIHRNLPKYVEYMIEEEWPHTDNLPDYSRSDDDVRLRQMAEWASFIETQFDERLPDALSDYFDFVFEEWGISDLREHYDDLLPYRKNGVGIKHRWYWAAVHALDRKPGISPDAVREWLRNLSHDLANELHTVELPASTCANQQTWNNLRDYIRSVLTIGGSKTDTPLPDDELDGYINAKKRGKSACAICGSCYAMRQQLTNEVAFQPGVYTQRIRLGARNNKRDMCTICALEQLLRQLFVTVDGLPTGQELENQKVRYLSFYPSYFFTPQTLTMIRMMCRQLRALRVSDKNLRRSLQNLPDLRDSTLWQRLDPFFMRPRDPAAFERELKYDLDTQSTFFTVGFRAGYSGTSDTEAWVFPVFVGMVMAICLDVKVVISDNDIPLMVEATELQETLWFDGVHSSIQQLISVRYDPHTGEQGTATLEPRSRLDVDSIGLALARVTAAYLIHLDTEYEPPKENWQRLTALVNALCESPLYVFHYLKKQERDDQRLSRDRIKRYIGYANDLFNIQGDKQMSHAQELVKRYRGFYRAKRINKTNSVLRPLSVVSGALMTADRRLFNDTQSLIEVARGELHSFMERVSRDQADGYFPKGISLEERQEAMAEFCTYFVKEIFVGVFNRDVAALRGKQINLLKSACEIIYRDEQFDEWDAQNADRPVESTSDES